MSKLSTRAGLLVILLATALMAAVKPNYRNLPQAQITPQTLGASIVVTASDAYLGDGGYVAVAGTGPVTVTITDGNGVTLGNGWSLPANNTLALGAFAGSFLPGGFTISCTGGGCATTKVYVSWYVSK